MAGSLGCDLTGPASPQDLLGRARQPGGRGAGRSRAPDGGRGRWAADRAGQCEQHRGGSFRSFNVGYWIAHEAAGRWITPTAVAMLGDHCLGALGLHRMEINIRPRTSPRWPSSANWGCGTRGCGSATCIDGEWRDHRSFAVTTEDLAGQSLMERCALSSQRVTLATPTHLRRADLRTSQRAGMQPSSLIFVVIAGVWAAFLVQHWIRRREHIATARSVDAFSETLRVLKVRPRPRGRPRWAAAQVVCREPHQGRPPPGHGEACRDPALTPTAGDRPRPRVGGWGVCRPRGIPADPGSRHAGSPS